MFALAQSARVARRRLAALAFCVALLAPCLARAQVATVRLEVDRHLIALGEALQVIVRISIDGRSGYSQFAPPTLKGFRVSSGGMSSQNIEVVNWRIRRRETHSYTAIPVALGQQTVGPAAIRVAGRWVKSNVIKVTVKKGSSAAVTPAPTSPTTDPGLSAGDKVLPRVFIAGKATPQKVYVGQQIVALWTLYTQSDVLGFRTLTQPTTDGFWSDDLRSPRRLEFRRKVLQGRVFYAALLARKALFPQRPGKLSIGTMSAMVRTLETFTSSAKRQSDVLEIEVLPLPEQGKPKGFAEQNVGSYDLVATLDRTRIKAGDAVTLRIVVRGVGNLRQLVVPKLGEIEGLKIYEPKAKERIDNEDRIEGEKVIEYLLLPTRSGKISIPPIALPYFDPRAKRYRKARSAKLTLVVTGKHPGDAKAGTGGDAKQNVLGRDIRPPRPARKLTHRSPRRAVGVPQLVLVALPLGVLLLIVGAGRLRAQLSRQTERSLGRAAARRVRAHLKAARDKQRAGEAVACFAELEAALREQLAHQLGERTEGLPRDELRRYLQDRGFSAALIDRIGEELDNCDFARFAPSASAGRELEAALERTRQLLRDIGATAVRPSPSGSRRGAALDDEKSTSGGGAA